MNLVPFEREICVFGVLIKTFGGNLPQVCKLQYKLENLRHKPEKYKRKKLRKN